MLARIKQSMVNELVRLHKAFFYSWNGLVLSWQDAGAFRLEICLSPFIVTAAYFLAQTRLEFFVIVLSWTIVIVAELINTALEAVTDLACEGKYHELAKKAKDCASAAVLIAVFGFILSWVVVV
jgi:diacylglycerol kinase (ATP)